MSVLKAELKQLVTTEVGVRVEDALEEAKRGLAIFEGRQIAMMDGAKSVEALIGVVDEELKSEKFDLEAAAHIKRYLTRSSTALQNLAQQAANLRMAQSGKIQGFEQTVALLKNMVDAERTKVEALREAEAAPPPQSPAERVLGARPMSIKEMRLAEDAVPVPPAPATAPEVVQAVVSMPMPPPVVTPAEEAVPLPVVRKRGRPKRVSNA